MERHYEGMFLLDSNWSSKDWDAAQAHVTALVEKVSGTIVRGEKWEDRKLAYSIRQQHVVHKRGTYFLAHLLMPTEAIGKLRREIELDDYVLRALFLRTREERSAWIFEPFPEIETRKRRDDDDDDDRRGRGRGRDDR